MTIGELRTLYPHIEWEIILGHVLKKSKEFLYTHPDYELTSYELRIFQKLLRRQLKGEPMAYMLGYKNFFDLRFKVTKDVLIPRPETEWLVEQVLSIKNPESKIKNLIPNTKYMILDLGTGSGCIAISLAHTLPKVPPNKAVRGYLWQITASDISKKALSVAMQNAKTYRAPIKFIHSDLFSNINQQFDIVIANLPYVPIKDYKKLHKNLKYEPKQALTDDTNNFNTYHQFFQQVPTHLQTNAIVLMEIDPLAKAYIQKWVKKYLPKSRVKFYKDLQHLWRYCVIKC